MTTTYRAPWNEAGLSEDPAVRLLEAIGYTYVPPEVLEAERESLRDTIVVPRLTSALRRLNPWLTEDNLRRAGRALTDVQAASLLEANEAAHTILAYATTVEQDRGDGKRSHSVMFLDFDRPERNEWVVTRQYRVKGSLKQIVPDVAVLVNGVPLVVIEHKSPTLGEKWLPEALDQLDRYQELSEKFRELGAPRLFHTVQLTIASCGQDALYATVGAPGRVYARWKDPFPRTLEQVAELAGRAKGSEPNPQETALCGLLAPRNLLDIVRGFVVFERDAGTGRIQKKVPRYQQFSTVKKALERAAKSRGKGGGAAASRGGVVWHTQGSGKSLTREPHARSSPTLDDDEAHRPTGSTCAGPRRQHAPKPRCRTRARRRGAPHAILRASPARRSTRRTEHAAGPSAPTSTRYTIEQAVADGATCRSSTRAGCPSSASSARPSTSSSSGCSPTARPRSGG
jgi:type I restriction enzyme, R subunit